MNYSKTPNKKSQLVVALTILISLFMVFSISGQNISQNNEMRKSLDFMFEHLDRNSVPKGLLRDYAVEYEDLDLFSGEVPLEDDNVGTIIRFGNLLKTISSSAVKEDPIKSFVGTIQNYKKQKKTGELTLGIILYEYARIKANALTDGLIRYKNGQVYNTNKDESPYQLEYAFAGSCLESPIQQSDVTFTLPSSFLLTNCDIKKIEIDFGAGFRSINPDKPVNASLNKGINKLVIRTTLQNGQILSAHTIVQVENLEIQRLSTSIVGPKVGTNGAQYSLSNTVGSVSWSSSNASIATINSSGVLMVNGTGVVTLTAQHGGQSYSQMIMVGMPRYILAATHEPGGYEINAECIDTQFKDYLSNLNGVLKYNWGVKYPNREIRWLEADVPSLKIDLRGQNEKVVVFLEVIDALGNKSALQHIEINSQDVYVAENQNLYIDAQGVLYKENKTKYLYNSARLYISYRANIPDKYKEREWMATTAMVLKPFSVTSVIDARSGGPLIKNILPVEELDYIKNNSADNQVYRYTLILLNYKSRAIQFVPVTFTYVTNI